jgi:hypothetical protein
MSTPSLLNLSLGSKQSPKFLTTRLEDNLLHKLKIYHP